jgi:predicted ribosomally synthesized peptide with nif11-like leader
MSTADVSRFLEMLDSDDGLVKEYAMVTEKAMRKALQEAVVALAASRGFEFTADQLSSHLERVTTELSDEELDQVAGGVSGAPPASSSHASLLARRLKPGGGGW